MSEKLRDHYNKTFIKAIANALPKFKENPSYILPILHVLKNDTEEYVRRSVANNLNDIAKDHPDVVVKIAKQ